MPSFREILSDTPWVLIDFYADWCGPCKTMAPEFKKAAGEWEGRVKFLKVNIDQNPQAAQFYGIQSVPTLILFQQGNIYERKSGALSAPQINHWLKKTTL